MSNEFKLLTRCLGEGEGTEDRSALVAWALEREIEWPTLIGLAKKHGIVTRLYRALRDHSDQVPSEVWQQLKKDYHTSIGRNLFVATELRRVVDLLKGEGIDVIPYKGPVLSDLLFGQPAIRESKDIDLLVHQRDLCRAKDLLLENGYRQDVTMSAREEEFLLRSRKEASYDLRLPYPSGEGKRLKIELHWRMPLTSVVSKDWYWENLEEREFQGGPVLTFPVETLLVILLCHGFRHYWESLKWLSDIDLIVRQVEGISWERFIQLSEELGVKRVAAFGLLLSHKLLSTPLPETIEAMLAEEALVQGLMSGAVENMTGRQRCPVGVANNIRIRERNRDRLFYFANLLDYVFLPEITDYRRFPLPRILWPLYFFIRPFKVLSCVREKYGLRRIGRLFVGKASS